MQRLKELNQIFSDVVLKLDFRNLNNEYYSKQMEVNSFEISD